MLAHLTAVRASVETLGYAVAIGRQPKPVPAQYVVLSAPSWQSPDESPLGGASGSLDALVRVKCVGPASESVLIMATRVRALLSPGPGRMTRVDVPSRAAFVAWLRSEFVAVDDSLTLLDGTHPTVAVDTYRITSERTSP